MKILCKDIIKLLLNKKIIEIDYSESKQWGLIIHSITLEGGYVVEFEAVADFVKLERVDIGEEYEQLFPDCKDKTEQDFSSDLLNTNVLL